MALASNTYRAAYEEADAELGKIVKEVEQLRARQNQVVKVAEALKSLVSDEPVAIDTQKSQWATR